ncbi:DNA polymerase III subunit gamma/tau [Fibrisoma limi BUZ 3]|uniref:DNA polymerase III subunit gamma/tau n=1 Tax=Fibrisoma limi BUZ 3 TaxID=1185876 RepID=I2GB35_9BACT|nr:hypothetical protein [Fibrisoma limi]CCH51107.1 DNA polymerase III subunit gamma/tau [Fibrisoma limi BUZ 3]
MAHAAQPAVASTTKNPLPPRPLPPTSRLRTTVSLTATPTAGSANTDQAVAVVAPTRPDKPFIFEQLKACWDSFAQQRQRQTGSMSEQLVLNRDLRLEGTAIHLTLDNRLQVDILTELKPDLLACLRDTLQNSQITIEHEVVVIETKKLIYSPLDKFNYMAEKNPALHELRKALGLEVDY